MRFIGREKELEFLEGEYARKSSYVAVMGREGFGQTALINSFSKGKPLYYFSAMIEIDRQCRHRFFKTLEIYTGNEYVRSCPMDTWEDLFRALANYKPREKKLVVIDNVQFLIEANGKFFEILRKCWDEFLSKTNIMLVTAGPIRTTTVQHYNKKAGIFRDGVVKCLNMRAFTFLDLQNHHPDLSFSQLVELFTFTGGVPKYLDMFGDGKHNIDCLEKYVMKKDGYQYELPLAMLEREVREPATYFSILNAIAEGNFRLHDIANQLGLKTNALGPYLSLLIKLHLVERRIPVTEATPEKSRKGMYVIRDNFLAFWFRFISPNQMYLEQGNTTYVRKVLEDQYVEALVVPSYVKVCIQLFTALCDQGEIDFPTDRIGYFWNSGNVSDVDIIAIDSESERIFVSNCYFMPEGEEVPDDALLNLSKSMAGIEELKRYGAVTYGLFTNTGFPEILLKMARDRNDVLLIRETSLLRP